MAKLNPDTIKAKIFVLGHAESWMRDQINGEASSDIFLNEKDEIPAVMENEALQFCNQLRKKILKLESQLKAIG